MCPPVVRAATLGGPYMGSCRGGPTCPPAVLWLVVVFLAAPAGAQQGTVTLDWYHAAGGVHRPVDPVPFHAILENTGREDRVVRLEGRWQGLDGEIHRRVELAAGARKEVDFYLGAAGYTSAFEVVLRSLSGGGMPAGEVIEEVQLSSVPLKDGRRMIGILGPHPMGWASLRRGDAFDGRLIHLEPERLPGAARGLGAFDVLVWPRPRPWRLRREQVRAVVHWLEDGGHLVLAGVETGHQALEPWTDTVAGEPLAADRLDALAAVAGVPLGPLAQPLAVTPLEAPAGRIWLREPWGALATEERRGLGCLTVLGFDPGAAAVAGWPGLGSFWLRLLERRGLHVRAKPPESVQGYFDISFDPRSVARALVTVDRGGRVLPVGVLGLLLALYLAAIGPGEYYLLRRLGKLKWTWVSFPLWVGLASAGAYAVAAGTRSDVDFTRHLLERNLAPGASSFRDQLHGSLFATRAGSFRLAPRRPGALPLALHAAPANVPNIRVWRHRVGGGTTVIGQSGSLRVGSWQHAQIGGETKELFRPTYQQGAGAISGRLAKWSFLAGSFERRAPAAGAGVVAELEPGAGGLTGRIVPRLGLDLEGAWLLATVDGRPARLRLWPRGDGEPIPVQGAAGGGLAEGVWDTDAFTVERLSLLASRPAGSLEHFVEVLAAATVRNLVVKLPRPAYRRHGWRQAGGTDPWYDWSPLLEAGGAVLLGWASDPEARLDLDAPGDGLIVYRLGIAPPAALRETEL